VFFNGSHARKRDGACLAASGLQAAYPIHHAPRKRLGDYKENTMSEHVYKQIELTGSSTQSSDDAVRVALDKASKTLRNMHWFEVVETRGHIEDGKILHWQVTIKVGLRID
jgi:flavin-binding protein dodecin